MVQYVNYISSVWADIILLVTLQNSLFLIGIFAALYFLRNHSIRLRRLIAIVGLAKLFIFPFISIPVLSRGYSVAQYFTVFTVYEMDAFVSQPLRDASLSVKSIAMIGWGVGVAALSIIVLFNILRMQVIIRNAEPVNINAQKNRKNRNIVYLKSDKVLSPAAFGLFKRRILLPGDWDSWQKPHKEIIIAHETSHFAIYDNWINLFMVIAASVYFYNPLTWLLYNRLKYYNEITCDNSAVLSANLTPNAYSANLVSIAEIIARPVNKFSLAPSFLSSKGSLSKRITYQLSKKNGDEMENSSKYYRLSAIVAIATIIPFSWYCSEEQIVSQEDPVQANVGEVIQEEEVPEFLPIENQPRPIGGIEAIQKNVIYPESAKANKIQGQVVIQVLVNEEGIPLELKIMRSAGHEELDEAATEAVRKTRFTPAIQNGEPVKFWMAIPIKFQLKSNESQEPTKLSENPPTKENRVESDDIPESLPLEDQPRPIGGIEAIQRKIKYPESAKNAGIQGQVVIYVLVDEEGIPRETKVLKSPGNSGLDEAAIEAIMNTKFHPAKKDGEPVKFWMAIPVKFQLRGGGI